MKNFEGRDPFLFTHSKNGGGDYQDFFGTAKNNPDSFRTKANFAKNNLYTQRQRNNTLTPYAPPVSNGAMGGGKSAM